MMPYRMQFGCENINWDRVAEILRTVGMASYDSHTHKKAFENSHTVVFVFDNNRMIGLGRAISDDAYQAALYDIAVIPEYQGNGIGTAITRNILGKLTGCNCMLYSMPGRETFYQKMGMSKMKTGMALFVRAEEMRKKGFIE
jgi:GNAT superfamily N-acetyltransferase